MKRDHRRLTTTRRPEVVSLQHPGVPSTVVTSCKLCLVRGACSGVLVALGHRYWILELHHSLLLDPEMHDMRLSAGGVERLRA